MHCVVEIEIMEPIVELLEAFNSAGHLASHIKTTAFENGTRHFELEAIIGTSIASSFMRNKWNKKARVCIRAFSFTKQS
jgi:hypothetical protein